MRDEETKTDQTTGLSTLVQPEVLCLSLGLLLLVGGGGLITISGLGIDVGVPGSRLGRATAIIVGALLLLMYFELAKAGFPDDVLRRLFQVATVGFAVVLTSLIVADSKAPLVPDMSGLTEQNAERMLAFLDIEVRGMVPAPSEAPRQQVIGQDIKPGSRSEDIVLTVSQGPGLPLLADVVGLDQAAASRSLADAGVGISIVFSAGAETAGQVVSMRPVAGTNSASVVLEVATGVPQPRMINVVGLSLSDAREALVKIGVSLDERTVESSMPVGEVIAQAPSVGTSTSGAELTISAGPGLPVVPDVRNLRFSDAIELLEDAGVNKVVTRESSLDVPVGSVISQDPPPGTRSAEVALHVSDGPNLRSFSGDWSNVDAATTGMTRMLIMLDDDAVSIQGFGSCTPNDCDWGSTSATLDGGRLSARFVFSFKTTTIDILRAGPLLIAEVNDFYVAEGRPDRSTSYTFALGDPALLEPEGLAVVVEGPILDELIVSGAIEFLPQLTPAIVFDDVNN